MAQPINLQTVRQPRQLVEIEETGSIEAVAIDDLEFDHIYQRDLSMQTIQEMAEAWDPKVAGAIVVNRRKNGAMFVIDGQHRTAAAKTAGETYILALVFDELTPREEAMMRVKGNFRKPDNSQDRFRAKLAAGDKESKEIAELCNEFGTRINFSPQQGVGINCVSTVEHLYRRDDGVLLSRVFDIIERAWGTVGGEHATVTVFKGIGWFIEHHEGQFDLNRLVDRLQTEGSSGLVRKARAHQAAYQGSMWLSFYRALVESYNVKLAESKRLQWVTTGRGGAGVARS